MLILVGTLSHPMLYFSKRQRDVIVRCGLSASGSIADHLPGWVPAVASRAVILQSGVFDTQQSLRVVAQTFDCELGSRQLGDCDDFFKLK